MKMLFIDTTTSNVIVSIVSNEEVLYEYKEHITSDMSSRIIPIIKDAVDNSKIGLDDIDKIFISNGPGSFTGIRVGVTVAKTIAWALKKEIVPISSLELIATTKSNKKYLVPMMDARRGNVFAGIYDSDLNSIKEDKLVNLEEFIKDLDDNYEFISYDELELNNLIKPNIDVLKIIKKHINDKGVNPHNLNPRYLKLTEAEESKLNG